MWSNPVQLKDIEECLQKEYFCDSDGEVYFIDYFYTGPNKVLVQAGNMTLLVEPNSWVFEAKNFH